MSKKKKENKDLKESAEKEISTVDKKETVSTGKPEKKESKPSSPQKEKEKKDISNPEIPAGKTASKKTFKPGKPLGKNPIINILDQHQAHRFRLLKLISGISLFFIVLFLIFFAYNNWEKQKKIEDIISGMGARLEYYQKEIDNSEGYVKDRNIIQAIIWTYKLEKSDWENARKWQNKRTALFALFSTENPEEGKNFVQPAIAMDMIAIPKGEFLMGRKQREISGCFDELPQRKVKIDYPFWMAATETANFQYKVFYPQYGVNPHMAKEEIKQEDRVITDWRGFALNYTTQPAVQISWHLADEYCKMLTYTEKKKKRLPSGYVYRLPTEAEWEYACRAGTDTYFFWGNVFEEIGAEYANCLDRNSSKYEQVPVYHESAKRDGHYVTAPVGSFKPNNFGLYDISGNVWEWCWDWYNPKAYYNLPETNPVQVTPVVTEMERRGHFERIHKFESTSKVIRGGGWFSPPVDCRSATRDSVVPEKKDIGIGFRIVLAPPIESLNSDKSK